MRVVTETSASAASPHGHRLPREGEGGNGPQFGGTADAGNRSVAIVGGGPAGMALALALKIHGIDAEIFEARARAAVRHDPRVLALSHGARQILDWLGVWSGLAATPIEAIHISQRGGFGRTLLRAADLDLGALGWVLPAGELIGALDAAIDRAAIVYREHARVGDGSARPAADSVTGVGSGPAEVRLVDTASHALCAFAEGRIEPGAGLRRDYAQHAVLCRASVAQPHRNVAWERFGSEGPLGLLPLGADYAVVLTCAEAIVNEVLALDEAPFLALLQARFGTRHRFTAAGPRLAYPLGLRYRANPVGERQVWLGNAAQTLHPVAGQGFNLALRDIWELARTLCGEPDPGAPAVLAAYARGRQADRRGAIGFTELLIDGFATDFAPLRQLRGAGLLALDLLPALRGFVAKRMIYGARAWP